MTTDPAHLRLALDAGSMCQRSVVTVEEGASVAEAAQLMQAKHVGFLVVTQPSTADAERHVIGVLTDRDIVVSVVARRANPDSLKVGDVMTRTPLLIGENHSLETLLLFMQDAGVRRVPVVGDKGQLVGVLSFDDILSRIGTQLTSIARAIRNQQQTERLVRP